METTTDTEYMIETGTLLKILSLVYQQSYGNDMKIDEEEMSRSASIYGSDLPDVKHFLLDNKLIKQVKKGGIPAYAWVGAEPSQEMADQFQTYLSTPKKGKEAPEKQEAPKDEQPSEDRGEAKKSTAKKKGAGWEPEEWVLLSSNPDVSIAALAATLHRTKTAIKGALGKLDKNEVSLNRWKIKDGEIKTLRKRLNYYITKETYSRSSQSYSNLEIDFIKNNIDALGVEKMCAKLKRTPAAMSTMKTKVKAGNLEGLKIVEEDEEILAILAMRPVEEVINTLDALTQEEDDILMRYIMFRDLGKEDYEILHGKLTRGEFHIDALLSLLRKREAVGWDRKRNNYYKIIRFEKPPSRQSDEQSFSPLEQDVSEIEKKELSSEEIIPQEEVKSENSPLELWRVVTAALANMSDAVKESTDEYKKMREASKNRPKKFKLVLLWGLIWYEKSE